MQFEERRSWSEKAILVALLEQLSEWCPVLKGTQMKDFHLPLRSWSVFSRIGGGPALQIHRTFSEPFLEACCRTTPYACTEFWGKIGSEIQCRTRHEKSIIRATFVLSYDVRPLWPIQSKASTTRNSFLPMRLSVATPDRRGTKILDFA